MAQLTVTPRTAGDVTLLGLAGKITISGGDAELREALDRQLDDGARKLLREVTGSTARASGNSSGSSPGAPTGTAASSSSTRRRSSGTC
ncbi:hypothetical protein [Streptomyces albidoflavus]|uniref:hypothetical protein n=1 Tax=Streptomyces albidoflavus TaxID=1886 RepID=UPI001F5D1D3B|nr:hypothetical protein [Streptomyces albidoflavus]